MPEPFTMSNVKTPQSNSSKPKGYDDLKTRLQKLQESPSFAVSAAPSATPPQADRWVQRARTPSSSGMRNLELLSPCALHLPCPYAARPLIREDSTLVVFLVLN